MKQRAAAAAWRNNALILRTTGTCTRGPVAVMTVVRGGGGVLRPLTVQRYLLYLVDVTIILVADSLNKLL